MQKYNIFEIIKGCLFIISIFSGPLPGQATGAKNQRQSSLIKGN